MDDKPTPKIDNELETAKQQAEEYLNNWKRERADFVNYKKDESRRVEQIIKFANEGLIMELVEALDDLEVVRKNFPSSGGGNFKSWLNEMDKCTKKFLELLNKYGVKRIEIRNKFDPMLHEAVEIEEGGLNVQEVRAGYTMNDRVIRPARVKIIK